jgi:hypothetical protein
MKTWIASGMAARTWRRPRPRSRASTPGSGGAPVGALGPLDLRAQRAVAVARVDRVLEEGPLLDAAVELRVGEKPVVASVDLAAARLAGRGRDRQLEAGEALLERADQGPLADAGGTGDDEDVGALGVYRRRLETSSWRWRSERPPKVLLGEMRHCVSRRFTFTRPYFGTASNSSETLAF